MVQDTGPGIPEDHLTTIFTPFEQVDGALNRRYGGSGLGLSIVKGYCDSLGGCIQVDSQVNHGTTFTVTLPFTTTDEGAARVPTDSLRHQPGIRILVADDRASFRASVRCRLVNQAAEVTEQNQTLPLLLNMPPPVQPYDVLIGRDLSRLPQEALSALTERITPWARYLVSLETVNDPSQWPWLHCHSVAAALWCGTTRAALQEALSVLVSGNPPTAMTEAAWSGELPPASAAQHAVLVAEDFEINRAIMAYQLQSHGFRVIEAGDGEEAVTKTRQGGVDLILMDIQMPGKDGLTAIREIRVQPDGAGLPILAFTASADKPTHHQIMAAGADKVLTKPISEAELIAAVQQALVIPKTARTAVSPWPSRTDTATNIH
jgi:CheY-like chemotaxis protein